MLLRFRADPKWGRALPSGSGIVMVLSGLMIVALGARVDYPELVAVGTACLSAFALAWLVVTRRPGVSIVREITETRVVEGADVHCHVHLTNRRPWRSPPLLITEHLGRGPVVAHIPRIRGRARAAVINYDLPAMTRGIYRLPPCTITRADPLSLMRRDSRSGTESVIIAYPKVSSVELFGLAGTVDRGDRMRAVHVGGVTFDSLREYVPGDDWRLIHWPSTARTGTLVVRHNGIPHTPACFVLLDVTASRYTEQTFDEAVRVAASFCAAAAANGMSTVLMTTAGDQVQTPQAAPVTPILDFLAGVRREALDVDIAGWPMPTAASHSGLEPVALAVVTGRMGRDELAAVSRITGPAAAVALVHIDQVPARARALSEQMVQISAATCAAFATCWNDRNRP